jgi:hypothetical protein
MIVVAIAGGALIVISVHEGLQPSKYGGIPIPGKGVLQLPKGKAIISFSGFTGGGTANGSGIYVPNDLKVSIYPVNPKVPAAPIQATSGSAEPDGHYMTEAVWTVEVPRSAAYHVVAKGSANTGYPDSELVFGIAVDDSHIAVIAAITVALLLAIGFGPRLIARLRGGRDSLPAGHR